MSLIRSDNWQDGIRLTATLMIATIALLATTILGLVLFERFRTEQLIRTLDDYHLTTALATTSAELEIAHILRNFELLRDHRQATAGDGAFEQQVVADTRASIYVLGTEIARVLDLQAEYADPAYVALANRLDQQAAGLGNVMLTTGVETQALLTLESTLRLVKQTLRQLGRLHVVGHDALQDQLLQNNKRSSWLLLAVLAAAFAASFYALRRGFSAISGLIGEQTRAAAALRDSEQRFRDYATSSADRYWEADAKLDWRWTDNAHAHDIATADMSKAMARGNLLTSGEPLRAQAETRTPIRNIEVEDTTAAGTPHWWRVSGVPVTDDAGRFAGYRGVATDITDQRLMAEQSRQLQRVDAIGRLTGGVAHDFNNILAVILGNLELLKEADDPQDRDEFTDAATQATLRGADLTKNLLSFARKASLEPKRVDLNAVVRTTRNWAARVLPETISIETSLPANLWEVDLDPASIESALLNLFLNARDAMPGGGTLTVETANLRIDEDHVQKRSEDLSPGRYVMLAVTDTGCGIDRRDLDQIFEPFFTTKAVGEGSGLGLSMVQGFVKQSGGAIRVHSEPGAGTSFKLYFRAAAVPATCPDDSREVPVRPAPEGARVLLVEDDPDVMSVLRQILVNAGFDVTSAASGDQALAIFKTATRPFSVIATDIVMPGTLQGPGLAREIRHLKPEMPVVFMSGYANEATVQGNGLQPEDVRLMKPVRSDDLLRAISAVLAETTDDPVG